MRDIYILGVNLSHDCSACLLRNGVPVVGINQERLDRVKHSVVEDESGTQNIFVPQGAVQYCLEAAGLGLNDLDLLVVGTSTVLIWDEPQARNLTKADVCPQFPTLKDKSKIHLLSHHRSHAASALFASPFEEAAILIVDGGGSAIAIRGPCFSPEKIERTTLYHGKGPNIKVIRRFPNENGLLETIRVALIEFIATEGLKEWDLKRRRARIAKLIAAAKYHDVCTQEGELLYASNSLGDMYTQATRFLGFGVLEEGKTMGLAAYGTDALCDQFMQKVRLGRRGTYQLSRDVVRQYQHRDPLAIYEAVWGKRRATDAPFTQRHEDLAYAVQHALEEALIHLANYLHRKTGSKNICLSGGVALNSVANQKILERTPFEQMFIQPAASDAGTALGNALYGWHVLMRKPKTYVMKHDYLGREYSDAEILAAVESFDHVRAEKQPDLARWAAEQIAEGKIIGWFRGGSEFGPRALGHRSIICDPRRAEMKDILNLRVKHRESFRPFAPSVLLEEAEEYFELGRPSPFMLLVAKVREDKCDVVPAITHADGTARVQTVTKEQNGIYYDLIREFKQITGVPLILNTSFNLSTEPIVESPGDAIRSFLASDMDFLVLNDFVVTKRGVDFLDRVVESVAADCRQGPGHAARVAVAFNSSLLNAKSLNSVARRRGHDLRFQRLTIPSNHWFPLKQDYVVCRAGDANVNGSVATLDLPDGSSATIYRAQSDRLDPTGDGLHLQTCNAVYADTLRLIGYDLQPVSGDRGRGLLKITYRWQHLMRTESDLFVYVHFLDDEGEVRLQQDHQLLHDERPTSGWQVGDTVTETHLFPVGRSLRRKSYHLRIGLWVPFRQTLAVTDEGEGERDTMGVNVGRVWVE